MTISKSQSRRLVVGISGASGAIYAQRLIGALVELGHEIHIVATSYGKRLLREELGMEALSYTSLHVLTGLPEDVDPRERGIVLHPSANVGAALGSGSFRHDGMVIMPCSSNTLGAIASGRGDELLTRAAAVCLKERFGLVLCHRESPLSLVDIENMRTIVLAGATVCPTNPGWYHDPRSLGDIVDFVVARALDQLGVEHTVGVRWGERAETE